MLLLRCCVQCSFILLVLIYPDILVDADENIVEHDVTGAITEHEIPESTTEQHKLESNTEQETPATSTSATVRRPRRLPNTTHPLHYDLHITTRIHVEDFAFQGNVSIELLVDEDTPELVLHSVDLEVIAVQVQDLTVGEKVANVGHALVGDLLVVTRQDGLSFESTHRLRLDVQYVGTINNGTMGFYRLTYQDANNDTVYYATTQMEPLHARTVLPCYDEPGRKATFSVTITHGSNFTAISNMRPIDATVHSDGQMTTTRFMKTPLMSTYLLAFVVSNFEYITVEEGGIEQRIYSPPNSDERGELALSVGVKAIDAFGRLFDIPYPLSKLDHVVIKESYGMAMENWGLITYRDDILPTAQTNDAVYRLSSIYTQHHEIAHQWFGNLVSPAWWDVTWLNEGFAAYYGHLVTDMLYPEFDAMEYLDDTCYLNLKEIKPIYNYVEEPDDILNMFGSIVYRQAPCVIKMFDHAFPHSVFLNGVSNYLKAHAYSVAHEDDLFNHLQEAMVAYANQSNRTWDKSVPEIMRSWIHGVGEPLVTVTRDYVTNIIRIEQSPPVDDSKDLWWIPLTFATASDPDFDNTTADFYMPPVPFVELDLADLGIALGPDDWLLLNVQGTGFYNVKYDDENLGRIAEVLCTNHTAIHKVNRGMMLHNTCHHRQAFDGSEVLHFLKMLSCLPNEREPYVWTSLMVSESFMSSFFNDMQLLEPYEDYIRNIVGPQYARYVAMPTETLSRSELTMLQKIEEMACEMRVPECLEKSKTLVAEDMAGRVSEKAKYKLDEAICHTVKIATDEEFDTMLDFYMNSGNNNWEHLACTNSQAQFERLLNFSTEFPATHYDRLDRMSFWFGALKSVKMRDSNYTWEFMEHQVSYLASDPNLIKYTKFLCERLRSKADELAEYNPEKIARLLTVCKDKLLPYDFDDTISAKQPEEVKNDRMTEVIETMDEKLKDAISMWLQKTNEVVVEKQTKQEH